MGRETTTSMAHHSRVHPCTASCDGRLGNAGTHACTGNKGNCTSLRSTRSRSGPTSGARGAPDSAGVEEVAPSWPAAGDGCPAALPALVGLQAVGAHPPTTALGQKRHRVYGCVELGPVTRCRGRRQLPEHGVVLAPATTATTPRLPNHHCHVGEQLSSSLGAVSPLFQHTR